MKAEAEVKQLLAIFILGFLLSWSIAGVAPGAEIELTELSWGYGGGPEGSDYLIQMEQEAFLIRYQGGLDPFRIEGVEVALKPALPPVSILSTDFYPYLSAALGRGFGVGLYGEFTKVTVLALTTGLGDLLAASGGMRLFLRGEYLVGNIGLRGHLQLEWGHPAAPSWPERTAVLYFPEWALVTLGSHVRDYYPGSSLYTEIRRRFSEELTLSEGFTVPLPGSPLAPGILFNAEWSGFAFRWLSQFSQAGQPGYTLLSIGFRHGLVFSPEQRRALILRLDLNFRWSAEHSELDLLGVLDAGSLRVFFEAHPAEGSWGLEFRWRL